MNKCINKSKAIFYKGIRQIHYRNEIVVLRSLECGAFQAFLLPKYFIIQALSNERLFIKGQWLSKNNKVAQFDKKERQRDE